ncbi:hypothetical protein RN001_001501 [Aquatica leii]|uniref:DUF4806 domain-containing protein n=1 Tax=Aquatica leii TaxID=1421715 RepID=A0AAN7QAF4_9COLE|nr:hypothetical protein RN001_001501 [Aquatica leii]
MHFEGDDFCRDRISRKNGESRLAIVNNKWLTPKKSEVFWPPYKTQERYNKSLKKSETPDEEKWTLYSIRRTFFESDEYNNAVIKLKRAKCTSDVNTDINEPLSEAPPKKRQRFKPRKLLDSSSDEDVAASDLPRPPPIHSSKKKGLEIANTAPRNSSLTYSIPELIPWNPEINENDIRADHPILSVSATRVDNVLQHYEKNPETALVARNTINNSQFAVLTGNNQKRFMSVSSPSSSTTTITRNFPRNIIDTPTKNQENLSHSKEFEEIVLEQLLLIKEQNNKLLAILTAKNTKSASGYRIPELSVNLPVHSKQELDSLCADLLDDNTVTELSSYFSTIGGCNLVTKVNNILKRSMSNSVAAQISFRGKTLGKQAFHDLKLKEVVVCTAKLAHPSATEKEIEDCMKIWLKHAPQRYKTDMKKQDL